MVAFAMPKKSPNLCSTPRCRNPKAVRRSGFSYGAKCHACRARAWRENQPMRAAFRRLRDHATARGIEFSLSFEEFEAFALKSEYIERKGPTAEGLTVDRKDNRRGYVPGNIQAMTRAENSVKHAKRDEIRLRAGYAWRSRYSRR